jgi:hypothetical protein
MAEERSLDSILKSLSTSQLQYVAARMYANSDADAARETGFALSTVYGWENKADIAEAIRLARMDSIQIAREKLRRVASKAVDVIEDELAARRGTSKRLDAALAALDRVGVSPKNTLELAGVMQIIKGYELISPDDWDSGKPRVTIAPPKPAEITDGSYIVVEAEPAAADVMSNDYVASDTA